MGTLGSKHTHVDTWRLMVRGFIRGFLAPKSKSAVFEGKVLIRYVLKLQTGHC